MVMSQEEFNRQRQYAAKNLIRISSELDELALKEAAEEMRALAKETEVGTFKIIIMGEFSTGKTTLLNAILGKNLLPSNMTPTTAIITRLRYGSTPKVVIKYTAANIPDKIISLKEFDEFRLSGKDSHNINTDTFDHIQEAIVYYPLDLLQHNVEIIDSPGLNDSPVRSKRTLAMLSHMDAVVFLMDAVHFYRDTERQYLENEILPKGLKNIFFVINFWNLIHQFENDPEKARKELRNYALLKLKPFCSYEGQDVFERRVFFVGAKQALEGKEQNKPALLDESNVPAFEESLNTFLIEDRGQVAFRRIVERIKQLRDIRVQEKIDAALATLSASAEELEQRQLELQPRVDRLAAIKKTVQERIQVKSRQAEERFYQSYLAKMKHIQEVVLHEKIDTFDFSEIGRLSTFTSDGKRRVQEIFEKETAKVIQREMNAWTEENKKSMGENFEELIEEIEEYSLEYQQEVNNIMRDFTGIGAGLPMTELPKPNWVAVGIGIICQDPAQALGGTRSFGESLKQAGMSIGVAIGSSLLLGPIGPIVWLGYQGLQIWKMGNPLTVARQLADGIRNERLLEKQVKDSELKIKIMVKQEFNNFENAVSAAIEADMKDLKQSLQDIIDRKKKAELTTTQEMARLEGIRDRFDATIRDMENKLLSERSSAVS